MFHLFRLPLVSAFPEQALLPLGSTSSKQSLPVAAFCAITPLRALFQQQAEMQVHLTFCLPPTSPTSWIQSGSATHSMIN